MTSHYEELRASVYKVIYPNGIPIELGCEISIRDGEEILPYAPEGGLMLRGDTRNSGLKTVDTGCGCCSYSRYFDEGEYKILGRPLSIESVLRALNVRDSDAEKHRERYNGSTSPFFAISSYGVLMQVQYPGTKAEGIYYFGKVCDLSKPLSAEENDAFCASVLALLASN